MSPRKRVYKSEADRVAAHRARLAKAGRVQLNVTVSAGTAEWIRAEAKRQGIAAGRVLDQLIGERQPDGEK